MRWLVLVASLLACTCVQARNPRGAAVTVGNATIITFNYVPPSSVSGVTGYQIGIRSGGSPGTYSTIVSLQGSATSSMLSTAIIPALSAGSYYSAVRTVGTGGTSSWTSESMFTISN